jgi:hypothetical protein
VEKARGAVPASGPPTVRVVADVGCWALFVRRDSEYYNTNGDDLGLSAALVEDLDEWVGRFTSLYHLDDPLMDYSSGSHSPEHYSRGWELAQRVRDELPDRWQVTGRDPRTRAETLMQRGQTL